MLNSINVLLVSGIKHPGKHYEYMYWLNLWSISKFAPISIVLNVEFISQ